MPWRNCVAVGRAYLLLRADLLEQFAAAQKELGYRYCRFHALFDRDMDVVERAKDGSQTFKWHQIDKIYDALLAMGIRPFVELNPMPDALASGTQQLFWYKANVTPPQDYREWELLVHEFAKHLVRRYGLDEVRKWYFEVSNRTCRDSGRVRKTSISNSTKRVQTGSNRWTGACASAAPPRRRPTGSRT